jgi:FSR family fosmidomycin resistance protein-like MFS transporter
MAEMIDRIEALPSSPADRLAGELAGKTSALVVERRGYKRDIGVTVLVTAAHTTDHFLQLVLPPLFPLLKGAFGVSYAELGLLMTAFYATSGLSQTAAGFLVDRLGPLPVLASGLGIISTAIGLVGIAPHFFLLFPLMILAGAGNSVFHPADYSLLTSAVSKRYIARAYGVHTFGGNAGWALAPMTMIGVAALIGWRAAFITVGCGGLLMAALVLLGGRVLLRGDRAAAREGGMDAGLFHALSLLFSPAIVLCFVYFALLSVALVGIQTFLPATLHALRGTNITTASAVLTAYLAGSAVGILVGGFAADQTGHHERIVAIGLAVAAVLLLLVGMVPLPVIGLGMMMAAAGVAAGITMPSRDMLARGASPPGATGKVFGFVYSGLDLGSAIAPGLLGALLDHHAPFYVFAVAAMALTLAISTTFGIKAANRRGLR